MNSLNISNLSSGYKKTQIIRDLQLTVPAGAVTCLLGRNGVGKTTLMKSIMGILPVFSGTVSLDNEQLSGLKPFQIAQKGIAYAPQDAAIFPQLTVEQNLSLVIKKEQFKERPEIFDFFPRLAERMNQKAGTLSGGEQKMLLVARALLSQPKLILLDEVSEGVQPSMIDKIGHALKWVNETYNTTILLVEQNINFSIGISDYFSVMDNGSIIDSGEITDDFSVETITKQLTI
ncbi:ABC transporter ATP-binding protein [Alkalihalobacterium alkalinitrilicum]|uniref:ABC transporter ATP-binding protein n=1 Tax=Alkalihalobacterium alkalinitrilicum TaxID=427920 RepID=UPI000995A1D4|nr:ABC transporter ATP-binding protein [Alkalihalobacterium alkalinitrilicum]